MNAPGASLFLLENLAPDRGRLGEISSDDYRLRNGAEAGEAILATHPDVNASDEKGQSLIMPSFSGKSGMQVA